MSIVTLIMGESGTGKSTSIRTLDPAETFIINVLDKPLPFKEFKKNYVQKEGGNYLATDNCATVLAALRTINEKRPTVKTIIIDDFQYIMANEFMRRAQESGWGKFTDIGQNAWKIVHECAKLRGDLSVFIMSHTETDSNGRHKCKTIGKMLDEKITLEGMFTVVLHSLVTESGYKFLTQHDGAHIAKAPFGMFDTDMIDNDLSAVKKAMTAYFGD